MQPLRTPNIIPTGIIIALLIISFLGFIDATYLTIEHFSGGTIECKIFSDCGEVTNSPQSKILGIPVALLGSIYYLVIFIASLIYLDRKSERILYSACWLTTAGLLFSAWFTYVQLFIIGSLCQYCLFSALTSTLLFILAVILLVKKKRAKKSAG